METNLAKYKNGLHRARERVTELENERDALKEELTRKAEELETKSIPVEEVSLY